jgi:RsiW-degrading membrane proteinase PrsW (M82 family)
VIYIENVFICITAPLLVAMLFAGKRSSKAFIFLFSGMAMCLLSAYINTFFARFYGASLIEATVELVPVIEESMKLLPLLFFLLVFEPEHREAKSPILFVAVGFATFENICYLIENGTSQLWFLLMRGFGTGAMHIVCGAIVAYGLLYVWKYPWLKAAGIFGLLCIAITFHSIFNLLLSVEGIAQIVGLLIPIVTVLSSIVITKLLGLKLSD